MALVGSCNSEKLYNFFVAKGYTKEGASAIVGNLDAESGLIPNRLEMTHTAKLGSDTYYTAAINNKSYSKNAFINDGAGYGLAQWTYFTRKRGLYESTVEKGLSIADLEGQAEYLAKELKGYTNLNTFLMKTNDINEASDRFLKEFERPLVPNYETRRAMSKKYYNMYANGIKDEEKVETIIKVEESEYETYEVLTGDGWWSIALKKLGSGTRMAELAKFNGLNTTTMLHPGDKIRLPILKKEVAENTTVSNSKKYTLYTVKEGDSWWGIAAAKMGSGTKMNELAQYNNRSTSSMLHPNQVLKIPCKEEAETIKVNCRYYTVKKKDTWASIASNEMLDRSKMGYLASYNGKTTRSVLVPGSVIKIPL